MVKYLAGNGIFPTKLNKMMFYADFLHFKRHGISISGLRYQAVHYGPVPVHYNTIYDYVPGLIHRTEFVGDHEATVLSAEKGADVSVFSDNEIATLQVVNEKLSPLTTSEIIELSHREDAWLEHYPNMSIIPFSDAYGITL